MSKIYLLESDVSNYSSFLQTNLNIDESIQSKAMGSKWESFKNSAEIKLWLRNNDYGKKNYQFDISSSMSPFFIISQLAFDKLSDILEPRGVFFQVNTESKRKKFLGYYPTNPLSECFDKEKSVYCEYPKGLVIDKTVLIEKNITDEYLFSIEEDISRVFVTEKFKQRVEEAELLGFDFSNEVRTS